MSLRPPAFALAALALVSLSAFLGCDGDGGTRDLCVDVCAHIDEECAADGYSASVNCEEQCRVELESRAIENGEDTCLECCVNVSLTGNRCDDFIRDCLENGNGGNTDDLCVLGDHIDDIDPLDAEVEACQRRLGFSICLDNQAECASECRDETDGEQNNPFSNRDISFCPALP
ncbi:MAG: hypothetical protein QF570_14815 [Myxococcota bacterium]|jgi:hypothetical protein|nr:hypothetical protein [Myxococcota bacterium]